jgi:hypothetical protein
MTFSKFFALTALAVSSLTTTAWAETKKPAAAPKPVDIKSMMIERCVQEATVLKVMEQKTAQKVCSCTTNVQASKLTLGEFWQIQSVAANGQDPRGLAALKRIQPELDKCRAGVKMNEPVYPQAPAGKN